MVVLGQIVWINYHNVNIFNLQDEIVMPQLYSKILGNKKYEEDNNINEPLK